MQKGKERKDSQTGYPSLVPWLTWNAIIDFISRGERKTSLGNSIKLIEGKKRQLSDWKKNPTDHFPESDLNEPIFKSKSLPKTIRFLNQILSQFGRQPLEPEDFTMGDKDYSRRVIVDLENGTSLHIIIYNKKPGKFSCEVSLCWSEKSNQEIFGIEGRIRAQNFVLWLTSELNIDHGNQLSDDLMALFVFYDPGCNHKTTIVQRPEPTLQNLHHPLEEHLSSLIGASLTELEELLAKCTLNQSFVSIHIHYQNGSITSFEGSDQCRYVIEVVESSGQSGIAKTVTVVESDELHDSRVKENKELIASYDDRVVGLLTSAIEDGLKQSPFLGIGLGSLNYSLLDSLKINYPDQNVRPDYRAFLDSRFMPECQGSGNSC